MRRFARYFLFLAAIGVLILAFVPFAAIAPFSAVDHKFGNLGDLNVDVAYQLAMPFFLEQNFQFGEQIIFTYGPWAILHTATAPIRWSPLIIIFRTTLVLVILFSSIYMVRECKDRRLRYVALTGLIGLWLLWFLGPNESFFMFPSLVVAYCHFYRSSSEQFLPRAYSNFLTQYIWILLAALSGWLSLVKFSYFFTAVLVFFFVFISDLSKRRLPTLSTIYLISLLFFWLAAGQDLANLTDWIKLSLNLSSGYSDAMAKGFLNPYSIQQVSAYYIVFFITSSLAFYHASSQRWTLDSILSFLLSLLVGLLSIRYAFGGNQIENSLVLLFMLLWFVVLGCFRAEVLVREKSRKNSTLAVSAFLIGCVVLIWLLGGVNFPFYPLPARLNMLQSNAAQLASWLRMQPTDYYSVALARSHDLWPTQLKFSGQTVDIYPQHTGVVIDREGLQYSPRPAFLSLNAHTRDLALLNKQHLEREDSPELIVFQVLPQEASVNNRHPATADGPSWPLLIANYDIKDSSDSNLLLLERRAVPRAVTRKPISNSLSLLGEPINLTDASNGILWAEIGVERSFLGNAFKLLYKSPHINIECVMVDDTRHVFQIVPELGSAGFIVSPLIKSNDDFSELFFDEQNYANAVREITVQPEAGLTSLWKKTFSLKIDFLEVA